MGVFQSLSDRPICQHAQILSLCLSFRSCDCVHRGKKMQTRLEAGSQFCTWKKKGKAKCEEKHEENAGCDFWTWTKPTPVIRHKLRRQCRLFKGKTKPSRQNFNYSGAWDCRL